MLIKTAICTASLLTFTASAQVWNPTTEFSIASNPNGVWSYGWSPTNFSIFTLHTPRTKPDTPLKWGSWLSPDSAPQIWLNISGSARYGVSPGQLSLHPGPRGEAEILRFTKPAALGRGTLRVEGRFWPGDAGTMQVAVLTDGAVRWHAVNQGAFSLTFATLATTVVDFAVYGGFGQGNTPLEATVTFEAACAADFNQGGGVDGTNVGTFFAAWELADGSADVNEDGGIDGGDGSAFFAASAAGSC